ncbi:DUF3077 domain-containing protein [Pseudomonas sp. GL93]|uniref:DUF3077 domain-containing protein n=1 Tax=Pseudomonas sp. GL93 TaxID=2014741 RepID=UPI002114D2BA
MITVLRVEKKTQSSPSIPRDSGVPIRCAWAAHYLGEMAKAVVDDLANGMLPNGVTEEGDAVAV